MTPDRRCEGFRLDLSAYIDDELPAARRAELETHLTGCTACKSEEISLRSVRKLVRVQIVENVPDLTSQIMARVGQSKPVLAPWTERFRVATVSAAAAALVILGASLPFDRGGNDSAIASEITASVRAAARELEGYKASFEIVERGWHEEVPTRYMTATIAFRAPEDLRLEVVDQTDYPSTLWPPNDVKLVATSDRWWIEEPSSCPAEALPNCAAPTTWAGVTERRVITNRQPFDGTSALPTDIIVPLETLAGKGFDVLGEAEVDGRSAYRLQLDYRQAVPLIASVQQGGAWREFHPLDQVHLWIDTETWFPLRFEVTAGTSPDRDLWATRRGLHDRPGDTLLSVQATGFSEPTDFGARTFRVPTSGIARDSGFSSGPSDPLLVPGQLAGLEPYRSGTTVEGAVVSSFSDGMEYLKMTSRRGHLSEEALRSGEEVQLGDGSFAYYLPASQEVGRRLEIAAKSRTIQMQTNLSRKTLLTVARSLVVRGHQAPTVIERSSGLTLKRIDPLMQPPAFADTPTYLPAGYQPATGSLAIAREGRRSYTIHYRRSEGEFDGLGIRIVQSLNVEFLPPSSEDFLEIRVAEMPARWSIERAELEWIDGDTYRAVAVPSADFYTAVRIAEGLR